MLKTIPANVSVGEIRTAVECLNLPNERHARLVYDTFMMDRVVLGWRYHQRPDFWQQIVHTALWANPLAKIETACPATTPLRNQIVESFRNWSYREQWLFSAHLYLGYVLSTPMQSQYVSMVPEFENEVLKMPLVEWLLRDMPIHDYDDRVVMICLFVVMWNVNHDSIPKYGVCCVYQTAHTQDRNVLQLLQITFSSIIANSNYEQLREIEKDLIRLRDKVHDKGLQTPQFENCYGRALWILQRALGVFVYR